VNVTLNASVFPDAQGRTVAILSFSGSETDPISAMNGYAANPSLNDGRYQLTIFGAMVHGSTGLALDGTGAGTPGTNYVSPTDTLGGGAGQLGLFRAFGDVTGNGIVDPSDLGSFRNAYNSSNGNAAYLSYLDADNSGTIGPEDLGQFRSHYNYSVYV
jgi:hypothetical protein